MIRDFKFRPGVIKDLTEHGAKPHYTDSDRIRFVRGLPQKVGGNTKHVTATHLGVARGMLSWQDINGTVRIAVGTECKLYALEGISFVDITPLRDSGTLTNPFDTSSGSAIVTVNHTAHAGNAGDFVSFSGASAVGGITIDGSYQIQTVASDSYTIEHSVSASSTVSGGGGSVSYEYDISCGLVDAKQGAGYGVGLYGDSTWGTARTNRFIVLAPRTWTLDQWGQFLVASPRDGSIYEWQNNSAVRAQLLTNAPTPNNGIFVTDEKHLVALRALGVEWCDQDDNTVWAPSDTNTAGSRTFVGGQPVFGLRTRGTNLVLSGASVWAMTFIGGLDVFGFQEMSDGSSGIVGPRSAIDIDGTVYWMGIYDFYRYDGVVRRTIGSKDVRSFVFDDLTTLQRDKCWAVANTLFSEVWWFYPAESGNEINRYVKYNYDERAWDVGTWVRTAGIDRGLLDLPVWGGLGGQLFDHETTFDDDGVAMNEYIVTAPFEIGDGDNFVDIDSMIIDFKNVSGTIRVDLETREYPQDELRTSEVGYFHAKSTRLDTRAGGRQAAIRISSDKTGTNWEQGVIKLDVRPSGKR